MAYPCGIVHSSKGPDSSLERIMGNCEEKKQIRKVAERGIVSVIEWKGRGIGYRKNGLFLL